MAGQSLIYSNARVKAMENSLLTSEKITRMAYSDSLGDAIKILYESNYGGGYTVDNPYAYNEILRAEESKVASFVREAMPDKSGCLPQVIITMQKAILRQSIAKMWKLTCCFCHKAILT